MRRERFLPICAAWMFVALALPPPAGAGFRKCSSQQWKKVISILRLQDLRSVRSDSLHAFLRDPDPFIRERAALALGNIQDTSALSSLIQSLTDADPQVETAAAFAVGQTATAADSSTRSSVADEVLGKILPHMIATAGRGECPQCRMIEELGKFAPQRTLEEVVRDSAVISTEAKKRGLARSIARFAIRGIRSAAATGVLLRSIVDNPGSSWETLYALQRIGSTEETRRGLPLLLRAVRHRDALARMNVAALLGKIGDSAGVRDALLAYVGNDPDWHVRVNAVRALATVSRGEAKQVSAALTKAFSDPQPLVAIAAASAFGSAPDLRDDNALNVLERILADRSNRYTPQLKGEAALALARKEGAQSLRLLSPELQSDLTVRAGCLRALGTTGSGDSAPVLLAYTRDTNAALSCAALDGLGELCRRKPLAKALNDSVYAVLLTAVARKDVAVRTTAASLLGDSLLLRSASAGPLIAALQATDLPADIEAFQAIAGSLGRLHDTSAIEPLRHYLRGYERSITSVSAAALRQIGPVSGTPVESPLEIPMYTDFDFNYIRALSDTVRIIFNTTKGPIEAELYPSAAPFTVMSVLKLAEDRKFYDGLLIHRVVPNFVLQGGDPRGDGWGGPGYTLRTECSTLGFETGSLGIASAGKDTEGSQFFITHSPQPHLDGRYTLFGRVVRGMGAANKVSIGDRVVSVRVLR